MSDDNSAEEGCWVVYHYDNTAMLTVFNSELEALRHAYGNNMQAKFVRWGEAL